MQSIVADTVTGTNFVGATEGMQHETGSEMDCALYGSGIVGRQFFGTDGC